VVNDLADRPPAVPVRSVELRIGQSGDGFSEFAGEIPERIDLSGS
jgi:hypothetical protein